VSDSIAAVYIVAAVWRFCAVYRDLAHLAWALSNAATMTLARSAIKTIVGFTVLYQYGFKNLDSFNEWWQDR
jgi:hypothetical protein